MRDYRLDILGISETRWKDFGEEQIEDHTLLYSGQASKHEHGVGILLSKKASGSLLEWKPVSERIITARFRSRVRNVTIVQCYAPTNAADLDVKEVFYNQLTSTLRGIRKGDIVICMGDYNAQIGSSNHGIESWVGKHALGNRSENGNMLVDLCCEQDLVIGGSVFPHKNCHKVSWVSPDRRTENQIDHVMISRKWRHSLLDVRNRRGADVNSDHHLVVAKISLKIAKVQRKSTTLSRRFDVSKLRNQERKHEFSVKLHNQYHSQRTQGGNVEEEWKAVKDTFLACCGDLLGHRNKDCKDHISADTWDKILYRKTIKDKLNCAKDQSTKETLAYQYFICESDVKRSARRDQRVRAAEIAGRAEHAANTVKPPSKAEIAKAIRALKNGKAPGNDDIPVEALKANAEVVADILCPLVKAIWEAEQVPEDWKEGILIKLPKKGDLSQCSNWRGITLLPMVSKVLCKILLHRMTGAVDCTLRGQQGGFRAGRYCIDQINVLRMILEQCNEMRSELFTLFVDFEKAFDRVKWTSIWHALKRRGIPVKIIKIIQNLYMGSSCRVMHKGQLSDRVPVTAGVKQGCLLSPLLFLIVLDDVMRKVTSQERRGLPWVDEGGLEDIDFADDLCLFATSRERMQSKTNDLSEYAAREGLRINCEKTKDMRLNTSDAVPIYINGGAVEQVGQFAYLGSVVDPTGGTDSDVEARINKARAAYAQLKPVWTSTVITRRTKIRVFNSNVKSVLLYGCETWFVRKDITDRLQVFVNKCLRRILGIFWPRTISNARLWQMTDQKPVSREIMIRKWRWIGHTLRGSNDHLPKQGLRWQSTGRRRPGRPRTTWRRSVEKEAGSIGLGWKSWKKPRKIEPNGKLFYEPYVPRIVWGERKSEQQDKYGELCNNRLRNIDFPEALRDCCENMCSNRDHCKIIDNMYRDIITALTDASVATCEFNKRRRGGYVVGWNKYVAEAHREARLRFQVWVVAGKHRSGKLFEQMQNAKRIFKSKLKWCQDRQEQLKMDKIALAHNNKRFKDFWKGTRDLNMRPGLPVSVEGSAEHENIAELFKEHFIVKSLLEARPAPGVVEAGAARAERVTYFTAKEIRMVINKMQRGKSPGHDGLSIEHFRPGLSTESAILSLKHTVRYYTDRKTPVYACFLDLSKAFDRVDYELLWRKLGETGLPVEYVEVLRHWYNNQTNQVKWANALSSEYRLECGVRQGGITSPKLFNLYVNGLIEGLSSMHAGCYVGSTCINNVSYADDMVLLGPSVGAIEQLLATCETYARSHGLVYNPTKSEVMVFTAGKIKPYHVPPIWLSGSQLSVVNKVKYLGHIITSDLKDDLDIERERRALACLLCRLRQKGFVSTSPAAGALLIKSPCEQRPIWLSQVTIKLLDFEGKFTSAAPKRSTFFRLSKSKIKIEKSHIKIKADQIINNLAIFDDPMAEWLENLTTKLKVRAYHETPPYRFWHLAGRGRGTLASLARLMRCSPNTQTTRTILTVADCECGVMHVRVACALRAPFDAGQKTDQNCGNKARNREEYAKRSTLAFAPFAAIARDPRANEGKHREETCTYLRSNSMVCVKFPIRTGPAWEQLPKLSHLRGGLCPAVGHRGLWKQMETPLAELPEAGCVKLIGPPAAHPPYLFVCGTRNVPLLGTDPFSEWPGEDWKLHRRH
ncbi:hypothetical protein MSG28_011306 [Choristoneura fumiferana]|uniref:Uncharacterized protein n=1 Tax=Choristoneura fumiferana TaxID=7141 RepID=A0ACC0KS41_CHOFU|nr:hypothetical protein MSG28_011306 [Choristoneura fumiferana]